MYYVIGRVWKKKFSIGAIIKHYLLDGVKSCGGSGCLPQRLTETEGPIFQPEIKRRRDFLVLTFTGYLGQPANTSHAEDLLFFTFDTNLFFFF